jgi:hypothetical protein
MDINKLIDALDNDNNDNIMNLTSNKIMEMNLKILKELHLPKETTFHYLNKLKEYRYIDEISDLKHGSFIRWIPITNPDYLPLHNCAMICDIKIVDDGVLITCKNFMHRYYTFKMNECLIFQKLTSQELVIISALDHLENTKTSKDVDDSNSDDSNSDDSNSDDSNSDDSNLDEKT